MGTLVTGHLVTLALDSLVTHTQLKLYLCQHEIALLHEMNQIDLQFKIILSPLKDKLSTTSKFNQQIYLY